MASKVETLLRKTLGEDYLETLQKFELWKPDTKSVTDHNEIFQGLKIVPRIIISFLVKHLIPMQIGETQELNLPVGPESLMRVTKHGPDTYSGEIIDHNKKLTEFQLRPLPGLGLVIMSAYELYGQADVEEKSESNPDLDRKVQKLIDERLEMHDLVNRVVDRKLMEKEAVHMLLANKLTEDLSPPKQEMEMAAEAKASRPLKEFLEKRKNKKQKEFSVNLSKSETVTCPDCGKNIFENHAYSGCICFGDSMDGKVHVKKSEDGIKIRFGRGWDAENMTMFLELLRRQRG